MPQPELTLTARVVDLTDEDGSKHLQSKLVNSPPALVPIISGQTGANCVKNKMLKFDGLKTNSTQLENPTRIALKDANQYGMFCDTSTL